jgi:hypothetical protein
VLVETLYYWADLAQPSPKKLGSVLCLDPREESTGTLSPLPYRPSAFTCARLMLPSRDRFHTATTSISISSLSLSVAAAARSVYTLHRPPPPSHSLARSSRPRFIPHLLSIPSPDHSPVRFVRVAAPSVRPSWSSSTLL